MNMKTMMKRFASLTVLLLALMLVFSGCASKAAKVTIAYQAVTLDETNNWKAAELESVGKMLASVYDDTEFDVRDMLIAASRGYDLLNDGDAANNVDLGDKDPVETAKAIIKAANEKAKNENKLSNVDIVDDMNEADLNSLIKSFQTTVDTSAKGGLWDTILCAIGACLKWITKNLGFNSYIVGICIFAVVMEILLLPFAVKQQKNTIRQAQLRPKEMAIRNKYKGRNDQPTQQKVAQEIQELYQRENFNPYNGCLPLLLQFPILIALYNIVVDPLHYMLGQGSGISSAMNSYYTAAKAAGGLGYAAGSGRSTIGMLAGEGLDKFKGIADFAYFTNGGDVAKSLDQVAQKGLPNFNIFNINFGETPSLEGNLILLLVPVLTFVVYFFSMRIGRKFTYQQNQDGATDRQVACSNTMMDVTMPLMSTFFAFLVPAVVGVYWMFRSVLGTFKQFIMSRVMPLPTFTEEDYKAAAREMAGKAPKKTEKSERAGTVRSLHYIDDEDYEDTRERALRRQQAMEAKEKTEKDEKAAKTPFGAVSMKKDRAEEEAEQVAESKENDSDN